MKCRKQCLVHCKCMVLGAGKLDVAVVMLLAQCLTFNKYLNIKIKQLVTNTVPVILKSYKYIQNVIVARP